MSSDQKTTTLWLSQSDLDLMIDETYQRSKIADLLLSDIAKGLSPDYGSHIKLLLREVYCLIEGNIPFFKERLKSQPYDRDGTAGYIVPEAELISLTTFSLNLKKISLELSELGISLETQ